MDQGGSDDVRADLQQVLAEAALGETQAAEVCMLLDVGEYGVALEHLASYVVGQEIPLSADAVGRIRRSAAGLGLQGDESVATLVGRRPDPGAALRPLSVRG